MTSKSAEIVMRMGVVLVLVLHTHPLRADNPQATLSGTVTDHTGRLLPDVKVSVKNLANGQSAETHTNSDGLYTVSNLAPGDYEVSVSVPEGTKLAQVTLAAGSVQRADLVLNAIPSPAEAPGGNPAPPPASNLPNAPSSSTTEPSLTDLGFPAEQTQGNAKQQALLDKRTHMLKIHQRMGLITTIPLLAAIFSSPGAGGKGTSTTGRDVHLALGAVAGDLYFITAYYAIRAPRVPGTETRGPIRVHKALAWIHGPGMILTPILGAIAYDQKSKGEKVHGVASAHMPVAIVTAGAFGAALLSVSVKF
jgi:hypothetical protein